MLKLKDLPKVKDAEIVFGWYDEDYYQKVLKEAREAKESGKIKRYGEMVFSQIFFRGKTDKVVVHATHSAEDVDHAWRFFKAAATSWAPKHENKEIFCGYILELLRLPE